MRGMRQPRPVPAWYSVLHGWPVHPLTDPRLNDGIRHGRAVGGAPERTYDPLQNESSGDRLGRALKRWGAFLAAVVFGSACGPLTWHFGSDLPDAAAIVDAEGAPPDAIIDAARASPDATSTEGGNHERLPAGLCNTESDCARFGLHCLFGDASPGACVPCIRNADCEHFCDPELNRCVQCEKNTDCRPDEVCIVAPSHVCVPSCSGGQVCPPSASFCDTLSNICLSCLLVQAECGIDQVCDPSSGQCVQCGSDEDCVDRKPLVHCDRTTSRCVECLRNSDCGSGVCLASGLCGPP
jgi:Cys-rich repeat protein